MNAGFEILVCDLEASQMRRLFVTDNSVPSPEHDPNRQPPQGYGNVFSEHGSFEWLWSATWRSMKRGREILLPCLNGNVGPRATTLRIPPGQQHIWPALVSSENVTYIHFTL